MIGPVLVAWQFLLIAVLAWQAWPMLSGGAAPAPAWALLAAGAALGAWALWANRPGNFNIRPEPRPGGQLVQRGPYRWVRHPMYSAVLLCGAACVWGAPAATTAAAWLALLAVLWLKALVEERWLRQAHAAYAGYCARTRRFVPGLL